MQRAGTSTPSRVLAVIGFAVAGAAGAQDADAPAEPNAHKLPDIVVTATRTEQSSFEIPASIDSVPIGDATDTLGVNPSEFLDGIPGVLARDRQNYAQDEQISIRGFGARATFGVRGVRLYTDGIPATMPDGQGQVSHFNLDSADRIEVLRGPFSALYGNSSGGVIQLFTADGTDPGQVKSALVGESYDTWRASVNARGVAGPADYNVDFTHFQTDGYRDHSAAQRESGNGKLNIKVGDGGKLTLLVNTVNIPGAQDPLGLTRAQFEADPRQATSVAEQFNTRKSVQQSQGGAIYEQDFGGGNTLRMMGYYGQRDVTQYLAIPVATQGNPLHSGGVVDLDGEYGGTDLRWIWKGALAGRPFEIAAGLAYDRQDQGRQGFENFVGDVLGVKGALRRDEDDTVYDFDQYA
ncbi:MAG TPA: TonB-dependent receptor plug domain-containing protein, partial [Rhodanobacteraceae bacterium]